MTEKERDKLLGVENRRSTGCWREGGSSRLGPSETSKPNPSSRLACPTSRFLIPIAFQQTNRPVPVVYSLNTEFQLCNNEKVFLLDPTKSELSLTEMDYKGAFSKGRVEPLLLPLLLVPDVSVCATPSL